jgi:hypothetical protein
MNEKALPTQKPRKKNWLLKFCLVLLVAFASIQFIQPGKNNQSVDMEHDISTVVKVPDTIKALLRTSCYDCHSNFTNYPWYSSIQPVGWWMKNHIEEGKSHINFQEFAMVAANDRFNTVALRQSHKLEEVAEYVENKKMPMKSYLWTHSEAKLSDAQRRLIIHWVDSARAQLSRR